MKAGAAIVAIVVVIIIIVGAYYVVNDLGYKSSAYTTTATAYTTSASSSIVGSGAASNSTSTIMQNSTNIQNSTNSSSSYTIMIGYNSTAVHGYYLEDANGFTLYYFLSDTPYSTNSTCYGECAGLWPAFYASNITVEPPLNVSSFNSIIRAGGSMQLTYNGYPLYTYSLDQEPEQVKGQGVLGKWYAFPAPAAANATNK
ncbi:MAG: COG4315 family predicted lipoprotein [Candidatus Micrarchaeaceae archaeon]